MQKIILMLVVLLFLAVPCFGQTLTATEETYAEDFLIRYAGVVDRRTKDDVKYWGYINGDVATKRTYLKAYIKDVILPTAQLSKTQLEVAVTRAVDRVTELEDYVKP